MVGIGFSARKSLFVALSGGLLPIGKAMPIELIELPCDAGAEGGEILEVNSIGGGCGFRVQGRIRSGQGKKHLITQGAGHDLAGIHVNFHYWNRVAPLV